MNLKLKHTLLCLCFSIFFHSCKTQTNDMNDTIYINPNIGNDYNKGSIKEPLKTLNAGIALINKYNGNKSLTLKLEPGLYALDTNLTIEYNKHFTKENRLTIEASIMPDDTKWSPETMPTIISASLPQELDGARYTYIFNIKSNHVTIRGIKFLGNPSLTTKHFCIYRSVDTSTDLKVSQCMFLGDQDALPVQVGVLTKGHNTEIEHCIFSNCRWSSIFLNAEMGKVPIKNSSIHHCIMNNCYMGVIILNSVDSDFQFCRNIVNNCNYFWVQLYFNKTIYTINNCIITNVDVYKGEWTEDNTKTIGNYTLNEKDVIKEGTIQLVKWKTPLTVDHDFLNVSKESLGYDLNAGIFKNK
jgi:hypothetical protein